MDEALKNELLKWMQGVGSVASEQAPLLARDIITRAVVIHGLAVGICFVVCCIAAFYMRRCWQKGHEEGRSYNSVENYQMVFGILALTMIIAVVAGVSNAQDLLVAVYAPRTVIVEFLK